jgi:hypothetical protein
VQRRRFRRQFLSLVERPLGRLGQRRLDGLMGDSDKIRTALSIWRSRDDAVAHATRTDVAVWVLVNGDVEPTWFQVEPWDPLSVLNNLTDILNDSHTSPADVWEVLAVHSLDDFLLQDVIDLRESEGLDTCFIFDFGDEVGGVQRRLNEEVWRHFIMPTEVFFAGELSVGAVRRLDYAAKLAEYLHIAHGREFLKRSVGRLEGERDATNAKEILAKWAEPEMHLSNTEVVFVLNDVAFISDSSDSHVFYFTHRLD